MIEAAVGLFAGWLWQKVADVAKSKDDETAIKKALENSIRSGFECFAEKYSSLANSLFDHYFLENHVGPELAKYLTRNKMPDVAVVAAAYRAQIGLSCPDGVEEAISDLLIFVMEAMKNHDALQSIIDRRQIEETNRVVKVASADASRAVELLEQQSQIYTEDQTRQGRFQVESLQAHSSTHKLLVDIHALLDKNSTPQSNGNEINKLLAKQLDMARDKIRDGRFKEAREILNSHSDEVAASDSFTKFRWHTNIATCMLVDGQEEAAAKEYFTAFDYAPEEEKALANRARAFLIMHQFDNGLEASEHGIAKYPTSSILWALKMSARMLLGKTVPDEGLPESLYDVGDILYSLSYIRVNQGRHQEAYELAHKCYEKDTKSFEAKRALLATALTWATVDPVIAHFGEISAEKMQATQAAIAAFEPIENTLETIQPEKASFEVTNNIAVALQLIGEEERSRRIALRGLQHHQHAEGLLRIRIKELVDKNDVLAIHTLTDGQINELPTGVLIILAQTYANCGELAWYENVRSVLDKSDVDEQTAADLFALSIHALWKAGKHTEAIDRAKTQLITDPTNVPLAILFARLLRRQGRNEESEKQAKQCLAAVVSASSSPEILQTADLLYDFGLFFEATDLYERLANTDGRGQLTQRYLICLVESGQRERARQVIEILPKAVRELSAFRRIEANLARATGDWSRLRDILKFELELEPYDSDIAVGYLGALHQLEEIEELKALLSTDPVFENGRPENEFEFAKYQAHYGFAHQGVRRLYRLFRAHAQDARIAGFYLLVLLLSEDMKSFPATEIVVPGVAVQLRYQNDVRWIVLEEAGLPQLVSWPEVVRHDSIQASYVADKKLGEMAKMDSGIGKVDAEIVQIENILLFAARKAHEVIAASAVPSGPLWSVNLGKPDGELDIEPILESLRRRAKHVERLFAQYTKQALPISTLADALGSDPVTLLLEWPYKHAKFFVSIGTHEEREQGRKLLRNDNKRYVLDLVTLAELVRCNAFEKAIQVLSTPLIPQTLRDQLLGLIKFIDKPKTSANMREEGGQFYITDIPEEFYEQRSQFLQRLLTYVNKYCEVVPTFGPPTITKNQRLLAQLLDNASIDAIYLALERNAVLLSEDGALRTFATQVGVANTLALQPLLIHLRDVGLFKQPEYSRIIIEKLSLGHDFVSVGSDDLLWAAKESRGNLSPLVKAVLETFKRPSLELESGINVCAGFLRAATEQLKFPLVNRYYTECHDALCYGREDVADQISELLRIKIGYALASLKRPSSSKPSQKFIHQLANEDSQKKFRLKKIVLAIRGTFK